jgi:hypothetical protein
VQIIQFCAGGREEACLAEMTFGQHMEKDLASVGIATGQLICDLVVLEIVSVQGGPERRVYIDELHRFQITKLLSELWIIANISNFG